jgi:elongator complex protein 2
LPLLTTHVQQIVVVGSWDKTVRVYDEAASEKDNPLLRTVQCAHAADITSIALSHTLGLIATGAADGTVKVCTLCNVLYTNNAYI